MAADHLIPPFPADIDRVAFGFWPSGFAAGEACFNLVHRGYERSIRSPGLPRGHGQAYFIITLRADDVAILELIRSYWQCGAIYDRRRSGNASPAKSYQVFATSALHAVVIPHFEEFPIRAEEQSDFEIGRRGVSMLVERGGRRATRSAPRWDDSANREFINLCRLLKANRAFDEP